MNIAAAIENGLGPNSWIGVLSFESSSFANACSQNVNVSLSRATSASLPSVESAAGARAGAVTPATLPSGPGTARQHVDQCCIADAKVREQRPSTFLDRRQNRRTIEIHGDDRRYGRTYPLECFKIGIAILEGEAAFVKELSEDVLRVQ